MSTPPKGKSDQRDALSESERRASAEQPESFKENETGEKIVEVLPIDGEGAAIEGIDPDKPARQPGEKNNDRR